MSSSLDVATRGRALPQPVQEAVSLSVVVTVSERAEDLLAFFQEYSAALHPVSGEHEFVFAFEPRYRSRAEALAAAIGGTPRVRVLVAGQNVGEAALVKLALQHCGGRYVLTLPAYHRVEPHTLPRLVERVEAGTDVAVARRWPRRDSWINRFQNWALHVLVGRFSGGTVHDVACGVRVFRRDVLEELPLYGELHRFLPLVAHKEGFRVEEVDAPQHPEDRAARIHSPGIYLRRLIDLLGLYFLLRFTHKPLRFFGLAGSLVGLVGAAILGLMFVQRMAGQGIADRPLLVLGVLCVVLGVQAVALGLIGEIIVHFGAGGRRPPYRVARSDAGDP